MHQPKDKKPDTHALRAAAEARLAARHTTAQDEADPQRLLHELRVHQIELEMQNEALRQTQAELEASRDRYMDLYEFAPLGYCTLTEDGTIAEINLTAVKLLGHDRAHLMQRRFTNLVVPKDQPAWMRFFRGIKASDGPASLELTLLRLDGTTFQAELDCVAETRGNQALAVRVAVADISERLQAQATQRVTAAAFRAISQGLLITGPDRRIVYTNAAFLDITGCTLSEILGRNCNYLQGPLTDPVTINTIGLALNEHREFTGEILNYRKDGTPFWNELSISPVLDDAGKLTHYVGVTRDVTERKQTQKALQATLAEREALLKEVHHRVKNNLQVISSLLRLESGRSLQPETKTVLGVMQGRIRAMANLHESLYRSGTLASIDLGKYLGQLATQAFHAQTVQTGSVALQLNMGSVQVGMDQATACGLLVNELISNCLKHSFPPGHTGTVRISLQAVDVESAPEEPLWRLCVRDTGIGLPPDFETRSKTSLGLQLAGDLSQQIGGKLTTASEPGAFTEFSVVFKALAPALLPVPTEPALAP